ncbi:MAG: hypothetical protein CYG61_04665 [Actinobacteria bacterium]|nr:MAG: hypothetical protein CYG61_04665 [Actinomycetota bacterium]
MLAATSVAWACTAQMSPVKVCTAASFTTNCVTSARPGTKIRASNNGSTPALKPASYYKLAFNNANRVRNSQSCHSAPYTMKSNILTSATGTFDITAYLPSSYTSAPKGVSQVCGIETSPTPGATATTHASFTIV